MCRLTTKPETPPVGGAPVFGSTSQHTNNRYWEGLQKKYPRVPSIHPLCNIFAWLSAEEFSNLVDSIKVNGLQEPIDLLDGAILDGKNRYFACLEADVEPKLQEVEKGKDALAYILGKNLHRRHLNESQRAMAAARLKLSLEHSATNGQSANLRATTEAVAKMMNVSARSVEHALHVLRNGTADLINAVDVEGLAVSAASTAAILEKQGGGPEGPRRALREAQDRNHANLADVTASPCLSTSAEPIASSSMTTPASPYPSSSLSGQIVTEDKPLLNSGRGALEIGWRALNSPAQELVEFVGGNLDQLLRRITEASKEEDDPRFAIDTEDNTTALNRFKVGLKAVDGVVQELRESLRSLSTKRKALVKKIAELERVSSNDV